MDTKDGSLNCTFQSAVPHTFVLGRHGKNSNLLYSDCSYKQGKNKHHLLPLACPKLTPVSAGIKSGTCLTGYSEVRDCCIGPTFPPHLVFQAQHTTKLLLTMHIPSSTQILKALSHNRAHSTLYMSIFPLSLGCPPKNRSKMNCKTHPCNA